MTRMYLQKMADNIIINDLLVTRNTFDPDVFSREEVVGLPARGSGESHQNTARRSAARR